MAEGGAKSVVAVPIFRKDKPYSRFIDKLDGWELVTSIEKKKRAITVALSQPENSEVRRRIFEESGPITELNVDDGMKKLRTLK